MESIAGKFNRTGRDAYLSLVDPALCELKNGKSNGNINSNSLKSGKKVNDDVSCCLSLAIAVESDIAIEKMHTKLIPNNST
ncbi:hypothetical protein [Flavilitoribacter nigricans]|uniref:Uncharacterized protein n=1 Tax=Flavilitoribacter nigricans (strain ATCC 23147 / DSM 23189 / NBRC 102662 / NCIMB 1420 / SS-2) TaxID=1122177 RepID=A0A2D0MY92_FLAN2|nr:hypothetical protein [Flavilitoribacter nigricans]PHN01098.1 hypothetical protein CRP01_38825 [Flavilitoribacter nigricans DSM 23189 = NBRC 102662]